MPIFDLFSKRQKRLRGDLPEVFVYDQLPPPLRVQVVHIWRDAFGDFLDYDTPARQAYKIVHDALCREYGLFSLGKGDYDDEYTSLANFLLSEKNVEKVLDAIELSFRAIEQFASDAGYRHKARPRLTAEDAVSELNARFVEHGVGYEYIDGELIRKDSEFAHAEIVKPALGLLRGQGFEGPNEEFRKAHEHYRHARYKECMNECLKALESTLKVICKRKGWPTNPNDTAKALLQVCFQNGLIPTYIQSEFTALRATLESGVPTVRNKTSGHGQGPSPTSVPPYLASYVLHLTATSILFLSQAADAKP